MDQETRLQAREHSKAYYERLKQDPAKLAARNARVAERMRAYRAKKRKKPEITPEITHRESEITPEITVTPSEITQPKSEITGPTQGGKHSPSVTQGEVSESAEAIIAAWQRHFDQQELEEERAAIRELGGG